jgi:outer membrane receptor for ferrienterochelin and colicins
VRKWIGLSLSFLTSLPPSRAFAAGGAEESLFLDMPSVVSASLREESINEAPVAMNVFTKEMIRRSGAKTLNDIVAFVPGFLPMQDADEANFGVRGIYGTTQQKTLIMRDGHPLPHMYLHAADPGHNISLAGIERVEIMRGPGGSLYGDMAQTGVINLISERGADVAGTVVSAGAGNFGQRQLDAVTGKKSDGLDILAYAHLYAADGEVRSLPASADFNPPASARAGEVVIGGITVPVARDLGIRVGSGNFILTLMNAYAGYQSVRSNVGARGAIIYPLPYQGFKGADPGLTLSRTNAVVDFDRKLSWADLNLNASLDDTTISANHLNATAGVFQHFNFDVDERRWGFKGHLDIPVSPGAREGSVLAGAQMIYHDVYNVDPYTSYNAVTDSLSVTPRRLPTGHETYWAGFTQYKQRMNGRFLINAGARYDHLIRRNGKKIDKLSPRLALILDPARDVNVKLSYTRAFKDAAYWNRNNTVDGYSSVRGVELLPETLDSYQVSGSHMAWQRLVNRLTYFYNNVSDIVYVNTSVTPTVSNNAGKINVDGLEYELEYKLPRFEARANYTFTRLISAHLFANAQRGNIVNWPMHMGSAALDVKPLNGADLWLHAAGRYIGGHLSPTGNSTTRTYSNDDPNARLGGVALVDVKATWDRLIWESMGISVKVENVFDRQYRLAGDLNVHVEQPGRWYFIETTFKF